MFAKTDIGSLQAFNLGRVQYSTAHEVARCRTLSSDLSLEAICLLASCLLHYIPCSRSRTPQGAKRRANARTIAGTYLYELLCARPQVEIDSRVLMSNRN